MTFYYEILDFIEVIRLLFDSVKTTYRSVFSLILSRKRFKNGFKFWVLNLQFFIISGTRVVKPNTIKLFRAILHNTKSSDFSDCIFKSYMWIRIKCNTYICMSHKILQSLRIHSWFCHVRAICVSANMRRNNWKRVFIYAVVFISKAQFDKRLGDSLSRWECQVLLINHAIMSPSKAGSWIR